MSKTHEDFAHAIQKAILKRENGESANLVMTRWLMIYENKIREAVALTVEQFAAEELQARKRAIQTIDDPSLSVMMAEVHRIRADLLRDVANMVAGRAPQKKGQP